MYFPRVLLLLIPNHVLFSYELINPEVVGFGVTAHLLVQKHDHLAMQTSSPHVRGVAYLSRATNSFWCSVRFGTASQYPLVLSADFDRSTRYCRMG